MLKVLDEICTPTKGSKYSACIDLYARINMTIGAGVTAKVPMGVCIDLDDLISKVVPALNVPTLWRKREIEDFMKSNYLELHPRSSLRAKGVMAGVGVIDSDFKDEIQIILHNLNDRPFYIKRGDKIAQIMIKKHRGYLFGIDTDAERTGGFGSTGD